MVTSERRPQAQVIDKKSLIPLVPRVDHSLSSEQNLPTIDFLSYHDPMMEPEAEIAGWEHGRNFLPHSTLNFLIEARNLGIVEKTLANKTPEEAYILTKALWFFSCTDASTTELSSHLEWKEKTDIINKFRNLARGIHRRSPEELQDKFPLKGISWVKEYSQRNRDTQSDAMRRQLGKDPIRNKVRMYLQSVENPDTLTPAQIEEGLGLQGEKRSIEIILVEMRKPKQKVLKETKNRKTRRFKTFISEANGNLEVKTALSLLTENQIYRNPNAMTASSFLRENGFIATGNRAKALANAAILAGIPFRTIENTRTDKNGVIKIKTTNVFLRQQADDLLRAINRMPLLRALLEGNKEGSIDNHEAAM